jgi:hypothetical protein
MIPTSSSATTNGCDNISSNCVVWQGPNIACINLCTGDTISDVTAKVAQKVCDIITDGVVANPDLTGLDLSCLNIQGVTPTELVPVLQAMVNQICINGQGSGGTSTPLPIMILPACLQYNDEGGNPVTQLPLDQFATLISYQVCTNLQSIQTINTTLSNFDTRISTLEQCVLPCNQIVPEKQVVPTCIINVGQLTDVSVLLLALETRFCALETAVGSPALINNAISQTTIQGSTNMLSTNGTYSSVTGWQSSPSTLAQSVQNAWSVIDDLYAAIVEIQNNCCPTGCGSVTFAYTTSNVLNAAGFIESINFNFTGSSIPGAFVEENGKSIISITDADGVTVTTQVQVTTLQSQPAGFTFTLPSSINQFGNLNISVEFGVTDGSSTCNATKSSVISSVIPCPPLTLTGITGDGVTVNFNNNFGTSAVFTIDIITVSTGLVAATYIINNPGTSVSQVVTGLSPNVDYEVRLTIAIKGQTEVCSNVPFTTDDLNVPCTDGMDIAFVLDYTGSMQDEIEDIKTNFATLVNTIDTASGANNYRIAVTTVDEYANPYTAPLYGSCVDYTALPSSQVLEVSGIGHTAVLTTWEVFSDNNGTSATTQVQKLNGGVDGTCINMGSGASTGPEPTDIAIEAIIGPTEFAGTFRSGVAKYVIVVTDVLPGGSDGAFTSVDYAKIGQLTQTANANGIKIFVCGAGTSGTYNNGGTIVYPWRELAINTGGNWNVSEDVTTISNEIIAGCSA